MWAAVCPVLSRLTVAVLGPSPSLEDDRTLVIFIHSLLIGTQGITFWRKKYFFSMLYQGLDLLRNTLEIRWITSREPHNHESRIITRYYLVLNFNML